MSIKKVACCDGPLCYTEETLGKDGTNRDRDWPEGMIVVTLEQARQNIERPTGRYFFCDVSCLARWAIGATTDLPYEIKYRGTPQDD